MQYWTFSKIIGSYDQWLLNRSREAEPEYVPLITQSLVGPKRRLARCPVLKTLSWLLYIIGPRVIDSHYLIGPNG